MNFSSPPAGMTRKGSAPNREPKQRGREFIFAVTPPLEKGAIPQGGSQKLGQAAKATDVEGNPGFRKAIARQVSGKVGWGTKYGAHEKGRMFSGTKEGCSKREM